MRRSAVFSPCNRYRYLLERHWAEGPVLGWVMLNPSVADDRMDDATVTKCIGFARAWGYGGLRVANLFALCSTLPTGLYGHADPIGPENDRHIAQVNECPTVIAAWGNHGTYLDRDLAVMSMLRRPLALGTNRNGTPKHPLYLAASTVPVPYAGRAAVEVAA